MASSGERRSGRRKRYAGAKEILDKATNARRVVIENHAGKQERGGETTCVDDSEAVSHILARALVASEVNNANHPVFNKHLLPILKSTPKTPNIKIHFSSTKLVG
jgi:hypothetical protein